MSVKDRTSILICKQLVSFYLNMGNEINIKAHWLVAWFVFSYVGSILKPHAM